MGPVRGIDKSGCIDHAPNGTVQILDSVQVCEHTSKLLLNARTGRYGAALDGGKELLPKEPWARGVAHGAW